MRCSKYAMNVFSWRYVRSRIASSDRNAPFSSVNCFFGEKNVYTGTATAMVLIAKITIVRIPANFLRKSSINLLSKLVKSQVNIRVALS